jgi:hypothetical protein
LRVRHWITGAAQLADDGLQLPMAGTLTHGLAPDEMAITAWYAPGS